LVHTAEAVECKQAAAAATQQCAAERALRDEMELKYREMHAQRRTLHDQVQRLKGNAPELAVTPTLVMLLTAHLI